MRHYLIPFALALIVVAWAMLSMVKLIDCHGSTKDGSTFTYKGWGFMPWWNSEAYGERRERTFRTRGDWKLSAFAKDYGIDPRSSERLDFNSNEESFVWFPIMYRLHDPKPEYRWRRIADQYNYGGATLRKAVRSLPKQEVLQMFAEDRRLNQVSGE